MKKSTTIITTLLLVVSLSAFGYVNWNKSSSYDNQKAHVYTTKSISQIFGSCNSRTSVDLRISVESRFMTTATKKDLSEATSIIDLVPKKATRNLEYFHSSKVTVLQEDDEITESGEGAELNTAQLTLLRSMPYSTNFRIEADCSERNAMTGSLEDYHLVYYMTLTPENGASYVDGPEALISYLKETSTNTALSIDENDLEPGRVNFTVTRKGELKDIELESTSGYETVDRKMVELISRTSGKWKPATNGQGEMVDQKLVLFFGKRGC